MFPSFLQKSTLRSGNTQLPSICCPTMQGLLQTPISSYASACVFSYFPHFSLPSLALWGPVCPHNQSTLHYTTNTSLLLFQLKNFLRDLEANECYHLWSSVCVTTVNVYSDVRFQFRDTGSQFTFTSLQIVTEGAHARAHTRTHASLMKTTFVLSCFVLLHNKKILLAQSTFAHRV